MQKADFILQGARIRTMTSPTESLQPRAVAVKAGRVLAVGGIAEINEAFRGNKTRIEDVGGAARSLDPAAVPTLTPGLIDAHLHPIQGADFTQGLDLGEVTTLAQLREALAAEAQRVRNNPAYGHGWVRGWNLDYAVFGDAALSAHLIDDVLQDVPALIYLFDFHTALASSAALARAGITGARSFTDSSEIAVDSAGRPTGELREESAYAPVQACMPPLTVEETLDSTRSIFARMRRSGLTGGAIMDGNSETLEVLAGLDGTGSGLPVRLSVMLDLKPGYDSAQRALVREQLQQRGARWRCDGIKLYADGVIDTGAGWLYAADTLGDGLNGRFWPTQEGFTQAVQEFTAAGFQVATHAIGDRAVGETITSYETVGCKAAGRAPHRIEHLELLHPADIKRLAATGITASMQLQHMQWRIPDGSDAWASRVGPERTRFAWNAGSLLRAGVPLALGSDWPIATVDAREGMAWAVLRRHPGEKDGFVYEPAERLTPWQALHGYTRGAALAQGDTDLGIIAPGARADFALWADDPALVDGDTLATLLVLGTYLDGEGEMYASAGQS